MVNHTIPSPSVNNGRTSVPQADAPEQAQPVIDPASIPINEADVWEYAARIWEHYADTSNLILHVLTENLRRNGYGHGESLLEITQSYGECPTALWRAARYLGERGVITVTVDHANEPGYCQCEACLCRRSWVTLPFDLRQDERNLRLGKATDAQMALEEERETRRRIAKRAGQEGTVYLLRCGDRCKIGITTNLNRRLSQLRSLQPPHPIEVIHHVRGKDYAAYERVLHARYEAHREYGEWFTLSADAVASVIEEMNEWAQASRAGGGGE